MYWDAYFVDATIIIRATYLELHWSDQLYNTSLKDQKDSFHWLAASTETILQLSFPTRVGSSHGNSTFIAASRLPTFKLGAIDTGKIWRMILTQSDFSMYDHGSPFNYTIRFY